MKNVDQYKEKIVKLFKEELKNPLLDAELIEMMDLESKEIGIVFDVIQKMLKTGELMATKRHKVGTPEIFGYFTGKIQITQKGFGFLLMESEDEKDIFIPAKFTLGAMNGDTVMVSLLKTESETKKSEGEVVKILVRETTTIIGTFEKSEKFGFVTADDKKIKNDVFVSQSRDMDAKDKDKVVVEILRWPSSEKKAEGKIVEIIGQKGDPGVDILSVIRKYGLPEEFNRKVRREADEVPEEVSEEEISKRKDFRGKNIVTIDGSDAKDLDDAIHVEILENGNYELGVHIADVTHYVKEKSKLDMEALKRATSVYLLDRVIPMLPPRLSNGICSLNPKVNRLTLSVVMEIDKKGKVVSNEIYESVIKTKERMNYEDVSNIIEGTESEEVKAKYEYLYDDFKNMATLAEILASKRKKRGAIDFDFDEAKIVLDEEGTPVDILRYERRVSNRMIESFMLAANETIAEFMFWLEIPFVYRVHEKPKPERLEKLNEFVYNFGYTIKGGVEDIHPKDIQKLLKEVQGTKEEQIISKLALRSMKQARYTPENLGHFGLAAKYYSHFTSPIRRYPDLQIHRIIHEFLAGEIDGHRKAELVPIVQFTSEQSSDRERNAELAERDVNDMKMAEYMLNHIGEEFDGVISSVTSFGMFIELSNTVEGLVRVESIDDDYYIYDENKLQYIGERSKKVFKLGDEVRIVVENANPDLREIDFVFA